MKSREEQVLGMLERVKEMRPMLDKSHIRPQALQTLVCSNVESLPVSMIVAGRKWLEGVYDGPYAEVMKVWKLCSPEIWERYALWGFDDGHREVKMLNKALNVLRLAVISRNRPDLFKVNAVKEMLREIASHG